MAYNDKNMINDYAGHKIPQYFNPVTDKYEPLHGANGVSFVGNHVLTESGIWVPQRGSDDGAINTQLTGSNVEEEILTDVILEPDEEINIGLFDVFNYSSYSFAVFSVDITSNDVYLISVRLRASTLNRLDNPEDATEFKLKTRGVTDKKDVTAPKIEVSIKNISSESMEISRMFLYKHR